MKCLLYLFFLVPSTVMATMKDSLSPAIEFVERDGLPNFFHRLSQRRPATVAYFGGSITRADQGWRDQSFSWLKKQFPGTSFTEVMAAIGGTGSDFGACRLYEHVLKYKPDLVFIEFSVNDHAKTFKEIRESVEGIIRQIRKSDPYTDICFIYTLFKGNYDGYRNGQSSVATAAMESLAEYYKIPSINVALPTARLIAEGAMILEGDPGDYPGKAVFAKDGVHPLPQTGHKVYADCITKHLSSIRGKQSKKRYTLPPALEKDNWEQATFVTNAGRQFQLTGKWVSNDSLIKGKDFSRFIPAVYVSDDTSGHIKITFKGKYFGIADIVGPASGQLEVRIDNDNPRYIDRFDAFCTYYRLGYFFIKGLEDKEHTVLIRNSATKLDKERILSVRNQKMDDRGKYDKQCEFLAGILVSAN